MLSVEKLVTSSVFEYPIGPSLMRVVREPVAIVPVLIETDAVMIMLGSLYALISQSANL